MTQALAHGLSGRADLPIPSWLFGWAASVVLVVSFVALATLWREPRLERMRERPLFRIPGWVDVACGAIGVALFALVVYAGLAGTDSSDQNFAPNFVYVHFWVGLVVVSALLGDVFRAFNPWLAIGRAAGWAARRMGIESPLRRPYPERLGRWPAVVGLVAFAWLELVYTEAADPSVVAKLALAYAAVQLVAMAVFGTRRWADDGDAFSVYFELFARLSPLVRRDGVLHARRPLTGAPGMPVVAGSVALVCAAIGITTFDGFSNGTIWADVQPDLSDALGGVEAADTVGLLGCIGAIALFLWLGVRGMQSVGGGHSTRELSARFAHTLVPIALAYAVAHYFSLLAIKGQTLGYLASDPLGDGSDLFGTANWTVDQGVLSGETIWFVQVAALIVGHVSGLVLAHDRALTVYKRVGDATRSQYWMLVVMVGLTSLGLWLLSAVRQ